MCKLPRPMFQVLAVGAVLAALTTSPRCVSAKPQTPNAQWAQLHEALLLKIAASCNKGTLKTDLTRDSVDIQCATKGGDVQFAFSPREDIAVKGSSCTASSKSISCRFIKAQPHYFDGLSTNDKVLKEYLTVDWEKTYDPEDADEFFAYENSDDISTMGPDDIAAAIKGKPEHAVIADVAFPWCDKCKDVQQVVMKAASRGRYSKMNNVTLAYVDAREHRDMAHELNVSCARAQCAFYVYKAEHYEGRTPFTIEMKDDFKAVLTQIEKFGRRFAEPVTQKFLKKHVIQGEVDHSDLTRKDEVMYAVRNDKVRSTGKRIVGFFEEEDHKFIDAFQSVAVTCMTAKQTTVRNEITFHRMTGDFPRESFQPPAIYVSSPDGFSSWGPSNETKDAMMASSNETEIAEILNRWIRSSLITPVMPYTAGVTDDEFDFLRLRPMFAFVKDDVPIQQQTPDMLMNLAQNYFGNVGIVTAGFETNPDRAREFGFPDNMKDLPKDAKLPYYAILDGFGADRKKYVFSGDPSDEKEVEFFMEDFLAGKLTEYLRSEEKVESAFVPGSARKLSAHDIPGVLASTDDVLLGLSHGAASGKDAKKFVALTAKIARLAENIPNFVVGSMDSYKNELKDNGVLGSAFDPAAGQGQFILIPGKSSPGGAPIQFTKTAAQKKVLAWLKKNSAPFKASYKTIGAMQGVVTAEKAAAKKTAKADAAAKQALLDAAEKEDLHEGLVFKQTYGAPTNPESAVPSKGAKIKAHYTGSLATDSSASFDSSRERGEPFEFALGAGDVIGCWDKGFATMRVGEKAMLTCDAKEAYGPRGREPHIPGGATLKFDVELLSYEGGESESAAKEEGAPATPGTGTFKADSAKDEL